MRETLNTHGSSGCRPPLSATAAGAAIRLAQLVKRGPEVNLDKLSRIT